VSRGRPATRDPIRPLIQTTHPENGHLWRYDHELLKFAADRAEIGEGNGLPPDVARWYRPCADVLFKRVQFLLEVPRCTLPDVA
jgi:hypothetical protein